MKIGLLPLYVKLYDDFTPASRTRHEAFYEEISKLFEKKGTVVVKSSFCRIESEFAETVKLFETENVDAIVTLHMAYSPSLESVKILSNTKLPIVVLDTTSVFEFDNMKSPADITYCHGIHGVMDMCCMLKRYGKDFAIAAGHYSESDVIERVCGYVRATIAKKAFSETKVAMFGGLFDGMGDFRVENELLLGRFGIKVIEKSAAEMNKYMDDVPDNEIALEYEKDKTKYDFDESVIEAEYTEELRSSLAVRKCIEKEQFTAFTANFRNMGKKSGLSTMPFLEACKSMENGIGYAGEGDPLTASLVGALLKGYPETTFMEIFCPDWKKDLLFLSHMGEVNYRIVNSKPYIRRAKINYAEGTMPYAGYARMKGGKGVFVNICPTKDDFRLVICNAEMQEYAEDNFPYNVRGWMKPDNLTTAEFLEKLSINGATHHSAFVYGATVSELEYFGKLLKIETVIIK
ncbi:MAG: hypothetical protein J5590_09405 [Clostridia bacterium]|nr:hypothetical protein [Clostridia bacterium]